MKKFSREGRKNRNGGRSVYEQICDKLSLERTEGMKDGELGEDCKCVP